MNVAVLEPEVRVDRSPAMAPFDPDTIGHVTEWIDPEGDDWFAEIFRELAIEIPVPATGVQAQVESMHWFG
jgi:hypothetical protein